MSVDVRKVKVGDEVVFTNPTAGYDLDITRVREMGLKVGRLCVVRDIDLHDFSCRLKLVGWDEWVNSVHFEAEG